uniref:Uncharacterized protein n=1 Tax=Cacopsylla melanoneura TaxID=428564 RepID=A0A8D8XJD4_9HEMI
MFVGILSLKRTFRCVVQSLSGIQLVPNLPVLFICYVSHEVFFCFFILIFLFNPICHQIFFLCLFIEYVCFQVFFFFILICHDKFLLFNPICLQIFILSKEKKDGSKFFA